MWLCMFLHSEIRVLFAVWFIFLIFCLKIVYYGFYWEDNHVPDFMEGCEYLLNTSERFSNKESREHTKQEMRRFVLYRT
jgi:hypothetical protein